MFNEYLNYLQNNLWSELITRIILFFGVASIFYFLFNKILKSKMFARKIQQKEFIPERVRHDVAWSLFNRVILSFVTITIAFFVAKDYSLIYTDINQYGWFYLIFSIFLVLFIHDTYFYFLHRLMHTRYMMTYVHKLHHHSTDPTPYTGYAFHPFETIIEFGFLPLIVFILPLHPIAFFGWQAIILLFTIYAHLGFEIMPSFWVKNPLTKFINTPTHHNMHHAKFKQNFGLYFNFWDRLLGTQHADYDKVFLETTERKVSESV